MINKSSDIIQLIQKILRRTHLGRKLNSNAIEASDSEDWKNYVNQYGKKECKVCGFIISSNYFISGCINCGSNDIKLLKTKMEKK